YRRGGRIDLVLDNLDRIIRLRRKLKTSYPKIIWQNLAFRYNEDRIPEIRAHVKKMGVDIFRQVSPYIPMHEDYAEWIPQRGKRGEIAKGPVFVDRVIITPPQIKSGETFELECHVTNRGKKIFPQEHGDDGSIRVGIKILDESKRLKWEIGRIFLPTALASGESIHLKTALTAPDAPGRYFIKLGMVKEGRFWFEFHHQIQERTADVPLMVQ
ncbi:hypothetical protein JW926_11505, partial [Candidatus Sumerlaeota bacterium]|nr:hypothetical protein [Candidatus Sumerlaeota bacterium]